MKAIYERIDRKFSDGLFRNRIARAMSLIEEWTSANRWLHWHVNRSLGDRADGKGRPWVSDIYLVIALLGAVVAAVVAQVVTHAWGRAVLAAIAAYRLYEIFLFSVNWALVHSDPLHSYRRSLAGFLINLFEVTFYSAAAFTALGCVKLESSSLSEQFTTAVYNAIRTAVTIGPSKALAEPPQSLVCGGFILAEIIVAYLLAVVVIANVVSAVRRRERKSTRAG